MDDPEWTAVYRLFGADGQLLYVGVSVDLSARFRNHGDEKPEWHQVVKVELTWYPSREAALAAESVAIKDERPPWNTIGTGRSNRQPGTRKTQFVIDDITARIASGEIVHMLPPARELRQIYGVSQMTIRMATERLKAAGLVVGSPGAGVYVTERGAPDG